MHKVVTRDVDLDRMRDLLERVPRACLSFDSSHGPQAQPVGLQWHEDRYLVSISTEVEDQPGPGQEVVLLIDEGVYYFDLRAVYIRGEVRTTEAPMDALDGRKWFEVVPVKIVAWDYGMLREARNES